jgi:predicted ATPase
MITKWKLLNFKSITNETELNFAPLTILAGANSSGKSTLLQSMLLIAQTLASEINSRSVVLNGSLTQLGQFDDVCSFDRESDQVLIGWECVPIDVVNFARRSTFKYPLKQVSCTVAFDTQLAAPTAELSQRQPSLFSSTLSATVIAEDKTDITTGFNVTRGIFQPLASDTVAETVAIESLSFQVELDDHSLREIHQQYSSATPVGCQLHHFLPDELIIKYHKAKPTVVEAITYPVIVPIQTPKSLLDASNFLRSFFSQQVKYLGPLRDEPRSLYPIVPHKDPTDVGLRGEQTAAVLNYYHKLPVLFIPPSLFENATELNKTKKNHSVTQTLESAVIDWLKYLGVAESVATYDRGKHGHELKVTTFGTRTLQDLIHVGVGVSQVLPILVMCLLAKPDSTLIIEQPELHLNPLVQTRLGDFFLSQALSHKQCIIETHSEYLINRLRLRLASTADDTLNSLIKTYFVEKKGLQSSFREVFVNEFGAIVNWPTGFFDQSQFEAEAIIKAAVQKRKAKRVAGREKANA